MNHGRARPLNLALVGMGAQGCEHLDAAQHCPDVRVVAGVEMNEIQREKVAQQYADLNMRLFPSIPDLKAAQQALALDGLILVLPHDAYEAVWPLLLSFGLPLLKEKPLGRHYEEAQRFVADAEKDGCALQTAIQRRHHPCYIHLRDFLREQRVEVYEIHAHLHLGKGGRLAPPQTAQGKVEDWRRNRIKSGGGALLDAGYHLVDLIQFLTGPFEVVSATMWAKDSVDDGRVNEDRSWLTGRSERCWIMLDTWVQGQPLGDGFLKSEEVRLWTNHGLIRGSREGVWHQDKQIYSDDRTWQKAMQAQLKLFAENIRNQSWQDESIWDQLPAMRVIEEAYRLSSRY